MQALKHLRQKMTSQDKSADMASETISSRIVTAFQGLAVCDALGAPLEFQARRENPDHFVRRMVPNQNFSLPEGHFTDDTSMALCLAHSLIDNEGKSNVVDQAKGYVAWLDEGYMSSLPGKAFDVGNQTRQVLSYWRKKMEPATMDFIGQKFQEEHRCGNGSLMRVLPCALIASSEDEAADLARLSSEVTHPHPRCVDACVVYSVLVWHALRGATKDQLIEHLQKQLQTTEPALKQCLQPYKSVATFKSKVRDEISSSGYVIDSLECSLWAFFTFKTFEQGAIEIVNLGNDADTVGAIYGGLAGAFYGNVDCIPQQWRDDMKSFDLVTSVADRLSAMSGN